MTCNHEVVGAIPISSTVVNVEEGTGEWSPTRFEPEGGFWLGVRFVCLPFVFLVL